MDKLIERPHSLIVDPGDSMRLPGNQFPAAPGLYVVAGRNNAGKTRFLDALSTAWCEVEVPAETALLDLHQSFVEVLKKGPTRVPAIIIQWKRDLASTGLQGGSAVQQRTHIRFALQTPLSRHDQAFAQQLGRVLANHEAKLQSLAPRLPLWIATKIETNRHFAADGSLNSGATDENNLNSFAAYLEVAGGRGSTRDPVRSAFADFKDLTEGLEAEIIVDETNHLTRWIAIRDLDGCLRPIRECGDGLRDLLMLVVKTRLHPKGDLFVDEPGLRLHPHLQRRLLGFFVEEAKRRPVWLATHDGVFIGSESARARYGARREGNQSVVAPLMSPEEVREEIRDIGWAPRDAYLADRVLYCEGRSDHDVFTAVCRALFVETPVLEGTDIEELGGDGAAKSGSIERIVGAIRRVAPFADHVVVLDSGIGSQGEQDAITKLLKSMEVRVVFLKRGELEDYFLAPALIAAVARELRPTAVFDDANVLPLLEKYRTKAKGSAVLDHIWYELLNKASYPKTKGGLVASRLLPAVDPATWAELKAELREALLPTGSTQG